MVDRRQSWAKVRDNLLWSIVGAFLGAGVGAALTILYFDPRDQVRQDLRAVIEEQQDDDRALAMEEANMLTLLVMNCEPVQIAQLKAIPLAVPTGANPSKSSNASTNSAPIPIGDHKLSWLEDVVDLQNEGLALLGDRDFDSALSALEAARQKYTNTTCFRDLEWEERIRKARLCDVIEDDSILRGWGYIRANSDADACQDGDSDVEDLLFCDAIKRSNGSYRVFERKTASRRLQQACSGV